MHARPLSLTLLVVLLAPKLAHAQDEGPNGVVIAVADLPVTPLLEEAHRVGGAQWEGRELSVTEAPTPSAPTEALEALEVAYFDRGELHGCLSRAQAPELQVDQLLRLGDRATSTAVLAIAATYAFQADDTRMARSLLERAVATRLDLTDALMRAPPGVQGLYAEVRRVAVARPPRVLMVTTDPPGALLHVDGNEIDCDHAPCRIELRDGPHVLVAEHLGYRDRVLEFDMTADEEREVALDRAPSAVARAQLGYVLGRGVQPDDLRLLRAAADAFSSSVVVVSWREQDAARAALFDASRDERGVIARARSLDAGLAVAEVIGQWRGLEPVPLLESPWLWVGTVLLVGAAVAATALAIELQPEPEFGFFAP
ncbi:MAG: PEGA domain-containing protein [Sandaracinaceae bacterium]